MRAKTLTVAFLAIMLSGCTSTGNTPSSTPTSGAPGVQPTPGLSQPPAAAASALAQVRSGAAVDLGLALAGDCLMGKDAQNTLWLRVNVAVNWIGSKFPETSYTLTADRGASPVTGTIESGEPFTASIGGKPADFLGRSVVLTVTVDPGNNISEFSEANNALKLTLQVGPAAPTDTADYVVACA